MPKFLKILLTLLTSLLPLSTSTLDPSNFTSQLTSLLPPQVSLHTFDLARTVNGYNLLAYALTAIPSLPSTLQLKDISYYPSTLIISYMHGTDENSFNLLFGFIVNFINKFKDDYYGRRVLEGGFLWLVPYVSIDDWELYAKEVDMMKGVKGDGVVRDRVKNRNRFPDNSRQIDCEAQYKAQSKNNPEEHNPKIKYSGVNLNFNFLSQPQTSSYTSVCSDEYAGPEPFSQMQTKGIRKLFEQLHITAVIDLQVGDDGWIVPNRAIWDRKEHPYRYLYEDVIKKMEKVQKNIKQQPSLQPTPTKPQSFTGGFVNYAASKNTLALKYLITSSPQGPQLQTSVSSAYPIIDMLVKKNAPLYNKYINLDKKILFLESISLGNFTVRCEIVRGNGESVGRDYEVGVGEVVGINLEAEEDVYSASINKDLEYRRDPQIRLFIQGTLLAQLLNLSTIPLISNLPSKRIPHNYLSQKNDGAVTIFLETIIITIMVLIVMIGAVGMVVVGLRDKKNGNGERKGRQDGYEPVLDGAAEKI